MSIVNTVYATVTCEGPNCKKTVTYLASEEQLELSKPENLWVLKTSRVVTNLAPAPGQQKPTPHLYCSDECEVNGAATGLHNVPEPKRIVSEPATASQVAQAAAAAQRAQAATEALKSGTGGQVTIG
jgi:hypothetical protein